MKFRTLAIAILSGVACTLLAKAETLIVAKGFETTDGPTTVSVFGDGTHRHYLYHSDFFLDNMPEGAMITGLAMRGDNGNRRIEAGASLSLALSTSPVTPPFINREFSKNIGPDTLTVFQGNISWLDSGPTVEAKPFSIRLPFQTPFYYDPRAGNLLLDFAVLSGPLLYGLDGFEDLRVVTVVSGIGAPIGDLGGYHGPIIELTYTSVPEPSVHVLVVLTLICRLLWRSSKQ